MLSSLKQSIRWEVRDTSSQFSFCSCNTSWNTIDFDTETVLIHYWEASITCYVLRVINNLIHRTSTCRLMMIKISFQSSIKCAKSFTTQLMVFMCLVYCFVCFVLKKCFVLQKNGVKKCVLQLWLFILFIIIFFVLSCCVGSSSTEHSVQHTDCEYSAQVHFLSACFWGYKSWVVQC